MLLAAMAPVASGSAKRASFEKCILISKISDDDDFQLERMNAVIYLNSLP